MKASKAEKYFVYFPLWKPHSWGKRSALLSRRRFIQSFPLAARRKLLLHRGETPDVLLKGVPNVIQPNQPDQ